MAQLALEERVSQLPHTHSHPRQAGPGAKFLLQVPRAPPSGLANKPSTSSSRWGHPDPDSAAPLFPTPQFPLLSPNWSRVSPWVTQGRHQERSGPRFCPSGKWNSPNWLYRAQACSWRMQSRGLSMEQKKAHQRVVGKGALAWTLNASGFSPQT